MIRQVQKVIKELLKSYDFHGVFNVTQKYLTDSLYININYYKRKERAEWQQGLVTET